MPTREGAVQTRHPRSLNPDPASQSRLLDHRKWALLTLGTAAGTIRATIPQ
jgi:hypothetical protein